MGEVAERSEVGEGGRAKDMQAPAGTRKRAKRLRKEMTRAEAKLWTAIRANKLEGHRFRRQHPLGPYVLDFYCDSLRLAVELDGGWHRTDEAILRDHLRDTWLAERGVRTLRLANDVVLCDTGTALDAILKAATTRV